MSAKHLLIFPEDALWRAGAYEQFVRDDSPEDAVYDSYYAERLDFCETTDRADHTDLRETTRQKETKTAKSAF